MQNMQSPQQQAYQQLLELINGANINDDIIRKLEQAIEDIKQQFGPIQDPEVLRQVCHPEKLRNPLMQLCLYFPISTTSIKHRTLRQLVTSLILELNYKALLEAKDYRDFTALELAAHSGQYEIVHTLLELGANYSNIVQIAERCLQETTDEEQRQNYSKILSIMQAMKLHQYIEQRDIENTEQIIATNPETRVIKFHGATALMQALRAPNCDTETRQQLISAISSNDAMIHNRNAATFTNSVQSQLFAAMRYGKPVKEIENLLAEGYNPNIVINVVSKLRNFRLSCFSNLLQSKHYTIDQMLCMLQLLYDYGCNFEYLEQQNEFNLLHTALFHTLQFDTPDYRLIEFALDHLEMSHVKNHKGIYPIDQLLLQPGSADGGVVQEQNRISLSVWFFSPAILTRYFKTTDMTYIYQQLKERLYSLTGAQQINPAAVKQALQIYIISPQVLIEFLTYFSNNILFHAQPQNIQKNLAVLDVTLEFLYERSLVSTPLLNDLKNKLSQIRNNEIPINISILCNELKQMIADIISIDELQRHNRDLLQQLYFIQGNQLNTSRSLQQALEQNNNQMGTIAFYQAEVDRLGSEIHQLQTKRQALPTQKMPEQMPEQLSEQLSEHTPNYESAVSNLDLTRSELAKARRDLHIVSAELAAANAALTQKDVEFRNVERKLEQKNVTLTEITDHMQQLRAAMMRSDQALTLLDGILDEQPRKKARTDGVSGTDTRIGEMSGRVFLPASTPPSNETATSTTSISTTSDSQIRHDKQNGLTK